jgi:hypothetical protein
MPPHGSPAAIKIRGRSGETTIVVLSREQAENVWKLVWREKSDSFILVAKFSLMRTRSTFAPPIQRT